MTKLWSWAVWSLSLVLACVTLCVLSLLEYGLPTYVPLWIYALIIGFSYALLFGLLKDHNRLPRFSVPALFSIVLLLFFSDTQDSPQGLMRQLHRIQPGMNIEQVETIMGAYNYYNALFGVQNTKRLPSGQLILIEPDYAVYKHSTPDDGAYNAAHGTVHFKNGKVTGVSYTGD